MLANVLLTVALLVAALVAIDVLGHRWRRRLARQRLEEARLAAAEWADPGTLDVRSWRADPAAPPLALPAAARRRRSEGENAYADNAYARPAGPPGRLL